MSIFNIIKAIGEKFWELIEINNKHCFICLKNKIIFVFHEFVKCKMSEMWKNYEKETLENNAWKMY